MALVDDLQMALGAAPDLQTQPGLTLPVAQAGGDVGGNAQVVAGTANAASLQTAHNRVAQQAGGHDEVHGALGWLSRGFHDVVHAGGKAVSVVGHVLNAPLQYVQHEYRYLHDVEARYGLGAAVVDGLGLAAGAGAGFLAGGPSGAVLGAEGATALEARVFHPDSWQITTNGQTYRDPHTGQVVSLGRDVASVIGLQPGTGTYKFVSGVGDALGDLALDPLAQSGRIVGSALGARGASGALGTRFAGTAPQTADDVARIYNQYGNVRRAFSDMAQMSPGEIAAYYPRYQNLARELGAASTPDEVGDVFRSAVTANQLVLTDRLPSLAVTRAPFEMARRAMLENGVGDRLSRMLTRLPQTFDPQTLQFGSKEFSMGDDHSAQALYRMLRFSESHPTAVKVVDRYLNNPDIDERRVIYVNAVSNALQTMAARYLRGDAKELFDDPVVQNEMRDRVNELVTSTTPGREAVMGVDVEGRNISQVDAAGKSVSAAITDNQVGKAYLPDFTAFKRTAQEMAGVHRYIGAFDDWAYQHITQAIFKPAALFTAGFALRVAASEQVLNGLRSGFYSMVKNGFSSAVAGLKVNADSGELGSVGQLAWHLLGGDEGAAVNAEDVQDLVPMIIANDAHRLPRGVNAGHDVGGEVTLPVERRARTLRSAYLSVPARERTTKDFAMFGQESRQYMTAWSDWLHEISNDPKSQAAASAYLEAVRSGATREQATNQATDAVADWLRQQSPQHLHQYTRNAYATSAGQDPVDSWARVTVENMKGATHSPRLRDLETNNVYSQETPHVPLVAAVADGTGPTPGMLADIPEHERPLMVKGRETMPDPTGTIERIAEVGFRRVLNPIINFLSRKPVYATEYLDQFRLLKPLVADGRMSMDEAVSVAQTRAVNNMSRFVHNLNDRTQFSTTVRNWAPFYFAQEQAWRRVARLAADNPGAFRQYQLMISGVHNIATQTTDAQGSGYVVIPGAGWLADGSLGAFKRLGLPIAGSAPVDFLGSLNSAQVVFPFAEGVRPGIGPVAAIPIKAIAGLWHGAIPLEEKILGPIGAQEAMWKQFVPNSFIQRMIEAGTENSRSFNSTVMQTIQNLDYQQNKAMDAWTKAGHSPTDPGAPRLIPPSDASPFEQQQFIDRVKNQTMVTFFGKAVLGLLSPLSPTVQVKDYGLSQALSNEIAKQGSVASGIQSFLAKNPDATPYTVFQSSSLLGSLPDSQEAENWVNANMDFIRQYPNAAAWFMPQLKDTKYNSAVYNEQIAQGLRAKKTPTQFLADLYTAAGNHDYYDTSKPRYDAAKAQLKSTGQDTSALDHNWSAYVTQLGMQNPVWWNAFQSPDRAHARDLAIAQMQTIFDNGDAPPGPQTDAVASLLNDYETYHASILAGRQDSWASYSMTQLQDNWQAYLKGLATQRPELAPVINKVFMEAT